MEQPALNPNDVLPQALANIQAQLQTLGDRMTHLEQPQAPPPLRRAAARNVPLHHDAMENDNMLGFEEDIREPPDPPYPPARRRDHNHRWRIREEERQGSSNPKTYIAWELHMEELFDCYNYTNSRKVAVAAARLMGDALTWWTREASERRRHNYTQISSWEEMKQHLRKRYVPYSFQKNFPNCFDRPIPSNKAVQQRRLEPQDKRICVQANPGKYFASVKEGPTFGQTSSTLYLNRPTHMILPKEYEKDLGKNEHSSTQTYLSNQKVIPQAKDKMNISNQAALHESQERFKQKDVQGMTIKKVSSDLNQNLLIYPMTSIMHLSLPKEADNYAGNKEKHINLNQTQLQAQKQTWHNKWTIDDSLIGVTKDGSSKQPKPQSHNKFKPIQKQGVLYTLLIKESSTNFKWNRTKTREKTVLRTKLCQEGGNDEDLESKLKQYQRQANKSSKNVIFDPGIWVWLHMRPERVPQKRSSTLAPTGDGQFRVLEQIIDKAYKLELPGEFNISSTFNVADLVSFDVGDSDLRTNPFEEGGNDEDIQAPAIQSPPMTRSRTKRLQEEFNTYTRKIMEQELQGTHQEQDQWLHLGEHKEMVLFGVCITSNALKCP